MNPVEISVVVPTCDRLAQLQVALNSVLNQTLQPNEIVVVDNGLMPLDEADLPTEVTLYRTSPRIGASRARNIGVSRATHSYVAFLDDDDTWAADYLQLMAAAIAASPILPACMLGRQDVIVNGRQQVFKCVRNLQELMPALLYRNPGAGGPSIVVCRQSFLEIGGFDEELVTAEDRALIVDFLLAGKDIVFVPNAVAIVGHHTGERLTDTENVLKGKRQFIEKYRYLMGVDEWLAAHHNRIALSISKNQLNRLPAVGLQLLRRFVSHLPARVISKLDRWVNGSNSKASLRLGISQFSEFTPIRKVQDGHALHKAGRLVLRGTSARAPVKIYESASTEHAQFIQSVSTHDSVASHFPDVHLVYGRYVVAEWVKHTNTRMPTPETLASLLLQLHTTSTQSLPNPGFDYWHQFIKPRFLRAVELMGIEGLSAKVITLVDDAWDNSTQYLMHPDLTPANLVFAPNSQWKIVDNELLTIGGLPLLDVCNTASALGPKECRQFVSLYFEMASRQTTQHDIDILTAAWFARTMGTIFLAGNLIEMKRIVMFYISGQNILPVQFIPTSKVA